MENNRKQNWAKITFEDLSQTQLKCMERIIENPNKNYLIQGFPGSGKTVIAAHILKILYDAKKEIKAGFLVFTKLLKKFVADGFDGSASNYSIDHYNRWNYSLVKERDLLIVDEAQDFDDEMIKNVKAHSKNQIWLGDTSQQIYSNARDSKAFETLLQHNNLEKFYLDTDFRNSLFIAKFASNFITLSKEEREKGITLEEKKEKFLKPILNNPKQTNQANNQPTVFIEARNRADEFDAIAHTINDIMQRDEKEKRIAIAHFQHSLGVDLIDKELRQRNIRFTRVTKEKNYWNLPDFKKDNLVVVSTIHSLKGLEFDYVFFPMTDIDGWNDYEIFNNLLYVLFTRARRRIYISYINRNASYVYNAIKSEVNQPYYAFVTSDEVLNRGIPKKSEKEIKSASELIKNHFDNFNL